MPKQLLMTFLLLCSVGYMSGQSLLIEENPVSINKTKIDNTDYVLENGSGFINTDENAILFSSLVTEHDIGVLNKKFCEKKKWFTDDEQDRSREVRILAKTNYNTSRKKKTNN